MTAINIKLPDSIFKRASEMAQEDGISLDQFVSTALAEKISVWSTDDYIEQRARRASRAKFDAALAQVPDVPAPDYDKL